MFTKLLLLATILVSLSPVFSTENKEKPTTIEELPITENIKNKIKNGEVYVHSKVKNFDRKVGKETKEFQSLDFAIAGLHTRDCRFALRKLSRYESFSKFLGVIKKSDYDEKKEEIYLLISSPILPKDMVMQFKIPRIKKPGIYTFMFDRGFLKGLTGTIHVSEYKKRCHFYTKADWEGPDTKFPNMVFELFTRTLGQISMERLFKISSTY